MNYILAIGLVSLLIMVHELGHFMAARAVRIPVRRFSVGFGPRLWGFRWGRTEVCLSAIPLGGYVLPDLEEEGQYLRVGLRRRLAFSLGGPLANVIVAWPLLVAINVARGQIGLYPLTVGPFVQIARSLQQILGALAMLFSRPGELSSVVGIVAAGGRFVGMGLATGMGFAVLLTLNLAVFNLLPLPPLDGGKIVLDVLQRIHPKLARAYVPVYAVGWVLILALVLFATVQDVARMTAAAAMA